jgi:hypothetical protein
MKQCFLLATTLMMSVSAMGQSGHREPLRGDLNSDGNITPLYASLILQYVAGKISY